MALQMEYTRGTYEYRTRAQPNISTEVFPCIDMGQHIGSIGAMARLTVHTQLSKVHTNILCSVSSMGIVVMATANVL